MKIKVGDKVRFTDAKGHKDIPMFYPKVGTVGEVVITEQACAVVQWPIGSIGWKRGRSHVEYENLELVG